MDFKPDSSQAWDIVSRVCRTFLSEWPAWSSHFNEIEDGYRYLAGDQYTPAQREWYRTQRRPTRQFNILFPIFNTTLGDFILQDGKQKVYSQPGGTPQIAALFEDLLDNVNIDNEIKYVFARAGLSGLIKCGWLHARYSDERHPDGSVVIDNPDEFEMMFYSGTRHPMLDDSLYEIRSRWFTLEQLMAAFPHHRKILKESLYSIKEDGFWGEESEFMRLHINNTEFVNEFQGKYRLIEYHERDHQQAEVAFDPETGNAEIFALEGRKADLYFKLHPNAKLVKRQAKIKYVHTVLPALNLLLDSKKSDIQDQLPDYVPFFAYDYGKLTAGNFGIFRNSQAPQDDFNEWRNLLNHTVAKAVNPGYAYDPTRLDNPQDVELYGNAPGQNFRTKNVEDPSKAIVPNHVPTLPFGPDQMSQEAAEFMQKITGITPNFAGTSETKQENASLFAQRVKQAEKSLQVIYNNFSRTKRRIYDRAIRLMQEHYTSQRMFVVRTPQGTDKEIIINQRLGEQVMNQINVGRYAIVPDDAERNPTERFTRFIQKTEVVQTVVQMFGGAIVNPMAISAMLQWWLKESDLGDIDKFIGAFAGAIEQQTQQAQEQQEQAEAFAAANSIIDLAQKKLNMDNAAEYPADGQQAPQQAKSA